MSEGRLTRTEILALALGLLVFLSTGWGLSCWRHR